MFLRLAIRNLSRNRRRTLAILLTVAMGSGSLFIFHGFNHGIMNQYRENTIHSRYGHGQLNIKGYRDQVFEKPWEHWISNWSALRPQLNAIPRVEHVFPRVEFFGLLTNGRVTVSGRGQGIDGLEESRFFTTLNIEKGVTLSNQSDGILLGKGLAKALDIRIGDRVTVLGNTVLGSLNGTDFRVVGIFHTGAKEFDDAVFRIPLTQAHRLLDTDKIESIAMGVRAGTDWEDLANEIKLKWPDLEATSFAVLDEVYYQHSVDWLNSQFGIIQIIILTIVILGIFNSVSTGIMDRKQEIGNLRANGESSNEVMKLLAYEGLAHGLIGSFLGIFLSYSINQIFMRNGILMPPAPGLTRQYPVMIEFDPRMAVISAVLSTLTALLATLIASLKVARLPIAESLRST